MGQGKRNELLLKKAPVGTREEGNKKKLISFIVAAKIS